MPRIEETELPGVGVRFEFACREGHRIGVIHHRTGRRELFISEADDPDSALFSIVLAENEAHALVELLGGSEIVEHLTDLQHRIEGLAIDWLRVDEGSPYADRTIGEARIRTRTGVSVVAVVREEQPFPAPGPDFHLDAGDVLVVVGTPEGIERVVDVLRVG